MNDFLCDAYCLLRRSGAPIAAGGFAVLVADIGLVAAGTRTHPEHLESLLFGASVVFIFTGIILLVLAGRFDRSAPEQQETSQSTLTTPGTPRGFMSIDNNTVSGAEAFVHFTGPPPVNMDFSLSNNDITDVKQVIKFGELSISPEDGPSASE